MYLVLTLRNRILHFTIIGLILLSFYTYYYAATNEIRQLSVLNTASSEPSSGAIRSILSTESEVQGTQSLLKNTSAELPTWNTSAQQVNGASSSNISGNAERSTDGSNVNSDNNSDSKNEPKVSSDTSNGGSSNGDANDVKKEHDTNIANKDEDEINANDAESKTEEKSLNGESNGYIVNEDKVKAYANDAESKNKEKSVNEKDNANNPSPISTQLTSQPLVSPSLAKTMIETAKEKAENKETEEIVEKKETEEIVEKKETEEKVEKKETKESEPVVPKIVKPDSAGAFYLPGHSVAIPEKCPDHGANLSLLILVASAPSNFEARMAIRHTWGHFDQRKDVGIAFLLGVSSVPEIENALKQESQMYGDLIRGRFVDSYSNLTLKTISALDWVINHCAEVKFVLKTDDDMFINIPRLLSFIRSHWKDKNVIFGRLARRWKPIRNVKSKYYVSPKQFRPSTFPDFTTGPAYLFSSDVAPKLYAKALEQTYLKLEDVFTTGIVAHYLNIRRIQANEFLNKRIAFSPCNVQKSISIHMVKYSEQFDLWKKLLDGKITCK